MSDDKMREQTIRLEATARRNTNGPVCRSSFRGGFEAGERYQAAQRQGGNGHASDPRAAEILGKAIHEAGAELGVVREDSELSGPQLLMVMDDIKHLTQRQGGEADRLWGALNKVLRALDEGWVDDDVIKEAQGVALGCRPEKNGADCDGMAAPQPVAPDQELLETIDYLMGQVDPVCWPNRRMAREAQQKVRELIKRPEPPEDV